MASDPGVDAWYKLFRVEDGNSNPVECHLKGYAHTAISFIVSEGYQGGGAHINVLDACVSSNNSGYKFIQGLRINDLGDVEVELNSGANVSIEITIIGDAVVPATLAETAVSNPVIKDSVTTLGNGMVRAFGDITSESGKIILNGTGQITGIDTVTSGTDAANKTYVDTAETDAIATAATASEAYTDAAIVTLVDSAPGALDTLDELATALGDDVNFSTTVTNSIAAKLPLAGGTMSGAIAMGSNNITGGGTITGTTLTGSSLDINGNADISGAVSIGSTLANNEYSLVTVQGRKSHMFSFTGNADHTLTLNSGSYYQAEVTITAHQTNAGTYNNIFIRGIWSNNHETHHWDELERVGSCANNTITITNGQNGSTANSGQLAIVHDYVSGESFGGMTVNVIEHFGASTHVIS